MTANWVQTTQHVVWAQFLYPTVVSATTTLSTPSKSWTSHGTGRESGRDERKRGTNNETWFCCLCPRLETCQMLMCWVWVRSVTKPNQQLISLGVSQYQTTEMLCVIHQGTTGRNWKVRKGEADRKCKEYHSAEIIMTELRANCNNWVLLNEVYGHMTSAKKQNKKQDGVRQWPSWTI